MAQPKTLEETFEIVLEWADVRYSEEIAGELVKAYHAWKASEELLESEGE